MSFLTINHVPIISIAVSIILVAVLWLLPLYTFPKDAPAAVLHYSVGVGIDFVGQGRQIMSLPLVATGILVINILLGLAVRRASTQAELVVWVVTPLILLILLAAYIIIWRLNT